MASDTAALPANKGKKGMGARALLIGAGALVAACLACIAFGMFLNATPSGQETSTARAVAELTNEATKLTPRPSATPRPSNTARPSATASDTPGPTDTPEPTITMRPSNTPRPTETATPLPEPVLLEGSGDSIVDFDNPFEYGIVRITGNAGGSHFAVINYDSTGNRIDLLVNTTDPYEGVLPLDFAVGEHTTRFEVTARGAWTIEVRPLDDATFMEVPGVIEGAGDAVIVLIGEAPDTAIIVGNPQSRHFAVIGHGDRRDLLVNTTDPYSGQVLLQPNTVVLSVSAVGAWTIEVK